MSRRLPAVLVGVLAVSGFFAVPGYLLYAGSTALASGLIGLGLLIPLAALRELPLHAAGLAGLAAYVFTYHGSRGGLGDHLTGIVLALALVVLFSLVSGLAALTVTGLYFAVTTLVMQIGIEKIIFTIPGLTGGAAGRAVWQPADHGWLSGDRFIYLVTGVVVLALGVAVRALLSSRLGFQIFLVGHVPEGATAMGLRNWAIKLMAITLSGFLIGVGGLLVAFINMTPPPVGAFIWVWSLIYLAIPIASGFRHLASIWLVAATFTLLPILLERLYIHPLWWWAAILFGSTLLAQNRAVIAARARHLMGWWTRPGSEPEGISRAEEDAKVPAAVPVRSAPPWPRPSGPPLTLVGRGITVDFGGIRAVDAVDVSVAPGQRVGIVGANGAGKTTLLNALTGFVVPAAGQVRFGPADVSAWSAMERARAGIRRSFQFPRLADVLTADQNVVAVHDYGRDCHDRMCWLMDYFGISHRRSAPAGELSFGQRRKLELVRALATRPQVLVLDEPAGGLMDEQADRLVELLVGLQEAEGWGLLFTEHNPKVLAGLSEHVLVMENGRVVAEGPTATTMRQEEVRRVYLGARREAGAARARLPEAAAVLAAQARPSHHGGPPAAAGLAVGDLQLSYGPMPVLRGVSLDCRPGQVVGVVGGNGVGKTSLLAGIAGLVTATGTVQLDGTEISRWPSWRRAAAGMVMVSERRRVLASLSVRDNLRAGGWGLDKAEVEARVERVFELFPRLAERHDVAPYRLSGGEQRMLSVGRALVTDARYFLLDEFSLSLSPRMVGELCDLIGTLAADGRGLLIVEQYIGVLLDISDVTHVLAGGRFVFSGPPDDAACWLEEHGYLAQVEAASTTS